MADEGRGATHAGFLPPEPRGPEPDLGRPAATPAAQPADAQPVGFAPPGEHEAHAPARPGHPPTAQQQLGWNVPPAGAPGYTAPPGNGPAVAGLTLSITSLGLLVLSVGTSSIISIACSALGIHYSKRGRARVEAGETTQHGGVAQAGFVTGIVGLVLSIICTIGWLLVAILFATDEDFRRDLKDELDDGNGDSPGGFQTSLQVTAVAVRLVAALIR